MPSEFKILNKGITETTKGDLLFDDDSAAHVIEAYKAYGNDMMIDYDHCFAIAAGWCVPEVREDGLWATKVSWTPEATKKLLDREYRYFSPAVQVEDSTGRVLELVNIALVNLPATKKQKALVASKDINMTDQNTETEASPTELADPGAQAAALEAQCAELVSALSAEAPDVAKALELASGLASAVKALSDALAAEETAEGEPAPQAEASVNSAAPAVLSNEPSPLEAELLQLTGAPDSKSALELLSKAQKELSALKLANAANEKKALIETLNKSGKLMPVMNKWAETQTLEALKAYGEAAPVQLSNVTHTPVASDGSESLSEEQKLVADRFGVSYAAYAKQLKELPSIKKGQ